jgi:hypothetical protein
MPFLLRLGISLLGLLVAAYVLVSVGALRSLACAEIIVTETALPGSFGPGAAAIIRRSVCPGFSGVPDRWTVNLTDAGQTDEVFRTFGRPWPGRVEARGQGASRRLLIHMEPRSLDGTAGIVEIAIGSDGRPRRTP